MEKLHNCKKRKTDRWSLIFDMKKVEGGGGAGIKKKKKKPENLSGLLPSLSREKF